MMYLGNLPVSVNHTLSIATKHTIYLEFTDSTDETIYVYYDDPMIATMITAYTPETYGQKTVASASLDGTAWYTRPSGTWETIYDDNTHFTEEVGEGDSYAYIPSLGSYTFTENSVWRVTWGETVKTLTAVYGEPFPGAQNSVWHIESVSSGQSVEYSMWNSSGTAWLIADFVDLTSHTKYVKIERQVSA